MSNSISNKNIILSVFPQFYGPNSNAAILAWKGYKHCPDLMPGYKVIAALCPHKVSNMPPLSEKALVLHKILTILLCLEFG